MSSIKKCGFNPGSFFLLLLSFSILVSGCEKMDMESDGSQLAPKKIKNPPPPPLPAPFYFIGCGYTTTVPTIMKGAAVQVNFSMSYQNSPGGAYPAFTSATVNGVTLSTPAGTLNTGSGSIVFTLTGTAVETGFYSIPMSIKGSINCIVTITVANAPASGPNADPGLAAGSTGIVNFMYRGQPVAYTTVRAKDGRIWLQQNLGSPQVAFYEGDQASYGDYFQWGRWDDGHQVRTSPVVSGSSSLMNPSHIPSGSPYFISGSTASVKWWGTGSLATDTWSNSPVSSTNGKDPCAALGTGWRLPTAAEWQNVANYEDLFGTMAAHMSNLKLASTGYRTYSNADIGYYWTSNASPNGQAQVFFFDNLYTAGIVSTSRAEGSSCRCIKD